MEPAGRFWAKMRMHAEVNGTASMGDMPGRRVGGGHMGGVATAVTDVIVPKFGNVDEPHVVHTPASDIHVPENCEAVKLGQGTYSQDMTLDWPK